MLKPIKVLFMIPGKSLIVYLCRDKNAKQPGLIL